jgi:hypothetical protein
LKAGGHGGIDTAGRVVNKKEKGPCVDRILNYGNTNNQPNQYSRYCMDLGKRILFSEQICKVKHPVRHHDEQVQPNAYIFAVLTEKITPHYNLLNMSPD